MKLIRILKLKCPVCGKSNMFEEENAYFNLKMHPRCLSCNEDFEREPGFYYGAMFISYIISGILSLVIVGILILVFKVHYKIALSIIFAILVLTFVYLYKVSRAIWLGLMLPKQRIREDGE